MSLIFIEGFDHQDLSRWTVAGTPAFVPGRLSGYGIELDNAADSIIRGVPTLVAGGTMSWGFAAKFTTVGGAALIVGPREQPIAGYDSFAQIAGDSTGWRITHYNGTSGGATTTTNLGAVVVGNWEHFQVEWTYGGAGVGNITVKRNGAQVYNYTGNNLYATSTVWPVQQFVARTTQSTSTAVIDDIWVSTGDTFGDSRVRGLVPTADVTKGWTTSTGTDHYALVDEVPPSMTDYVSALGGSGLQDTYTLTVPSDLTAVTAVQVNAYGLKTDAGTAPLRLLADGQQSADLGLGTTAAGVSALWRSASGPSTWTAAKLGAAGAIGIRAQ